MEPTIELAQNHGLTREDLGNVRRIIEAHADEIRSAWRRHFRR